MYVVPQLGPPNICHDWAMRWNPLVPELSVNDIVESLDFYVKGIGFTVLFTRDEPLFAYLDLNGAQLMLEEDHPETWFTARVRSPRGRGLNLQIEVPDVNAVRSRLMDQGIRPFRELRQIWYQTSAHGAGLEGQLEYLVQDPDGYLIRLVQVL